MADAATLRSSAARQPASREELDLFAPVYPFPRLEIASGSGCWVTDAAGHTYLDFVSGIAVNALGHAPEGLADSVGAQMHVLGHCSNLFANRPAIEFARLLCGATGYDRVFFCNSGTEGVEAALKFARAHARARGLAGTDILAFRGGFHGRTGFALSATWTPRYRSPFEPLVPGVRFADMNDLDALDGVLDAGVAAVIVEPVQGEAGAVPAERDFLYALRARTSALGATLVFDEVQCGMGRCGRLLAAEHYGVNADMTVLSKALGGGLPLGAVLMRKEVATSLTAGMHGCTFGGGPVAATAGVHVLEQILRPGFLERVRRKARMLETGLTALVKRFPDIVGTRGLGLLRAVVLRSDAPFTPDDVVVASRRHELLVATGGDDAVRLLPPLTVTGAEIAEGVNRLSAALDDLSHEKVSP